MSDTTASVFVRGDLVAERPAPVKTTGFVGFLRTRLFNSPTNILLTIVGALLLWFTVVPALKFLLVDAVWTGKDRTACLAENAGHVVGACWPFIQAKFTQFIYGFYPEAERWRVNLTFILAAILLLPLLIPRLPAKGLNAGLFFGAFPVVAFFLLHGGGLGGLGVSWTAGLLSGFNDSIGDGGRKLAAAGETTAVIGPLLWLLGKLIVLVSTMISWLLWPLTWLREMIQAFGRPVWADFVLCAGIAGALVFWLSARKGEGLRPLVNCLAIFAGIGIVIALMGLDHGGLPVVDSADPDFLDCLHRVLARGSADHGAVLRNLYVAAVRSDRFHHRRIGARPDRDRAVYRRLPGRKYPRRPASDPARAGGGGERARPVLEQDHGAGRDAAGVAPRHPRSRQ